MQTVLDSVNGYLHEGHGRGVFDPPTMEATRRSNCFGRQAMIGAALSEALPAADVLLLIGSHHGMECTSMSGRPIRWLAHAETVVLQSDASYLIDTTPFQHSDPTIWGMDELEWEPGDAVALHPARNVAGRDMSESALQRLYGPPPIRALNHAFDVYPLAEGVAAYQRGAGATALYSTADYLHLHQTAQAAGQAKVLTP